MPLPGPECNNAFSTSAFILQPYSVSHKEVVLVSLFSFKSDQIQVQIRSGSDQIQVQIRSDSDYNLKDLL